MKTFDIWGHLTKRALTDSSGAPTTLPELFLGDKYTFALNLLDELGASASVAVYPNVRAMGASVGLVQVAPLAGSFTLKFGGGGEVTDPISLKETEDEFFTKVNAVAEAATYNLLDVRKAAPGIWLLRFAYGSTIPLQVATNALDPESFVRFNQWAQGGSQWVQVSLLQAPIAATSAFERVLGTPPSMAEIRAGSTVTVGLELIVTTEVQALTIPPDFQGTFTLKVSGRSTSVLSQLSSVDTIAGALNALYPLDTSPRFSVTNPIQSQAYIEFIGDDVAGIPQALIEVTVTDVLPGPLNLVLELDTQEVLAALRVSAPVTFQFEIWLEIGVAGDDIDPGVRFILFREPVVVDRPLNWEGLETAASVDWLQPPSPVDYIPFTRDQVLTGQQQAFPTTIGDGTHTSFAIAHNLDCQLCSVLVVEDSSGRLLRDNEYVIVFNSVNQLTISGFASTPTTDQYSVLVIAIGPASVFQAHTHTIGQIIGLQDELDDLSERISAIEDILPGQIPPTTIGPTASDSLAIEIPDFADVLFLRASTTFDLSSLADGTKAVAGLPPTVGLLPAINKNPADGNLIIAPLPAPTVNALYTVINDGVVLPGGYGVRAMTVNTGDFVGSDGRILYKVNKSGTTHSYFPSSYERTLFTVFINDAMFRVGSTFSLDFKVALQLINSTSNAQYFLVIEVGAAPSDPNPATTETNLQDITWIATPLLKQRLILTSNRMTHSFGGQVLRSLLDVVTANKKVYGSLLAGDQAPATANFAIRARLIEFDTENSVVGARGLIYYALSEAVASIA